MSLLKNIKQDDKSVRKTLPHSQHLKERGVPDEKGVKYEHRGDFTFLTNGTQIASEYAVPNLIPHSKMYEVAEGTTHITPEAFKGSGIVAIKLPESVVGIMENAFEECRFLQMLTYKGASNVESICDEAFRNCWFLQEYCWSKNLKTIGKRAFMNCFSLQYVHLPASVTEIGEEAFAGCYNLEGITVDHANPKYISIDNCLIDTETKTLIVGCKNSIIPTDGSVTSIADYAFADSGFIANLPACITKDEIGRIGVTNNKYIPKYNY